MQKSGHFAYSIFGGMDENIEGRIALFIYYPGVKSIVLSMCMPLFHEKNLPTSMPLSRTTISKPVHRVCAYSFQLASILFSCCFLELEDTSPWRIVLRNQILAFKNIKIPPRNSSTEAYQLGNNSTDTINYLKSKGKPCSDTLVPRSWFNASHINHWFYKVPKYIKRNILQFSRTRCYITPLFYGHFREFLTAFGPLSLSCITCWLRRLSSSSRHGINKLREAEVFPYNRDKSRGNTMDHGSIVWNLRLDIASGSYIHQTEQVVVWRLGMHRSYSKDV